MKRALLFTSLVFLAACAGPRTAELPPEPSVKPGINTNFLDPEMNVDEWVARFEGESREIFAERDALAAAVGLHPGDGIADVGAGTGLFLDAFAAAVGSKGVVYAVDISPAFIDHLNEHVEEVGLANVRPHLCSEDSVELPPKSIDKAFICDTYHHFEYPRHTMTSIRSALGKNGEVVIVDFERIPGVSREWVLDHVRAGKAEVIAEMESFGFEMVEEIDVPGLEENYVVRFRKR